MQYYGYAGGILYVDLTSGQIRTDRLDMAMANKFLGGCGIGERLLFDLLEPGTDPLSPENPIVISAGPLVGTLVPSSSKIQLITKSATPANREQSRYCVGWSSAGSNRFGMMMKNAGYDQIVITGRASRPVYLKILDDDIEVCNATDLWGNLDIFETTDELTRRHENSGVIAIGKGGENLVTFALGLVDKMNRLGRNGGATVMGSKNLKAIVVYGTKGVRVREPKRLLRLADNISKELLEKVEDQNRLKASAVRPLEGEWARLYPPELSKNTLVEMRGCGSCAQACKGTFEIKTGKFAGTQFITNFFSHVSRYGIYMELREYRDSMKLLSLLDSYGICYVTALAMIRFITDLYERGTISKTDIDGLELKIGDIDSYIKLVEKIANREGIGDTMARGWYALSEQIGIDEDTYEQSRGVIKGTSIIIGAQERSLPLLLETVVSPRGGMHQHPPVYFPNLSIDELKEWCRDLGTPEDAIERIFANDDLNSGRFIKHVEDGECIYFALGLCAKGIGAMYGYRGLRSIDELYEVVTGIQVSPEELKKTGERIWNLYKLLNVREGFTRLDDKYPGLWKKSIDEPIKTFIFGELQLKGYYNRRVTHADIHQLLDDYYEERGWDADKGIPTREKLLELGLDEFVSLLAEGSMT
jgi:aldehyde:ferredoxin oxidoreductase